MKKILHVLIIFISINCSSKDENTAKLSFPEVAALLGPQDTAAFFYTRDIDKTLTTNCGIATPGVSGTTGTTPGTTTPPTGGTTGTSTSKYTILSQIFFQTGEALTLKFIYDSNQFQGTIDQQQGFTLTGGIFGHTVTGRQGAVKWDGQGIGYIDAGTTSTAQTLSFMIINLNLKGTFTRGETSSTTTPSECNTDGLGKCTSTVTTAKCFTQDFINCITSSVTGTTAITIAGSINCNAENVIPQ